MYNFQKIKKFELIQLVNEHKQKFVINWTMEPVEW